MKKVSRELARLRLERENVEAAKLEEAATHALELEDLRLAGLKLRGKARRLEGAVLQKEIFDERARELQRIARKEMSTLDDAVRSLEDCLYEHEDRAPVTAGTCRVLRRDLQDLCKLAQARRKELDALRADRRKDAIDQVSAESMTLAVQRLSRETAHQESELEKDRLRWAALNARAHVAKSDTEALARRRDALAADRDRTAAEVQELEFQTALAKRERDKEEVLDRFVAKHTALHHPGFVTERSSRDRATTARIWRQVSAALDALETSKIPQGAHITIAKLRVEATKMHAAVLDALQREEGVADALVDMVPESDPLWQ